MQRKKNKVRSPVQVARETMASYVYWWFIRGGGKLFKPDGTPTNKGLARGTEDWCRRLQEARELERERKRKGD